MSLNAADLIRKHVVNGRASSAGTLDLIVRAPGQVAWQVEQATISMPSAPAGSVAFMFHNDDMITPMIPAGDAAGGDPPLALQPGDILKLSWTGVTPGDPGKVTILYREARFR